VKSRLTVKKRFSYKASHDTHRERNDDVYCLQDSCRIDLLVATMAGWVPTASAAPVIDHLAIKNASASTIDLVQWRDGDGDGDGMGAPRSPEESRRSSLGSALAAPYYYGPGPYYPYYPRPIMHPRPPLLRSGYGPAPGGNAVAYCTQRFRSYDPRSGTYLGTDGHRHPCP